MEARQDHLGGEDGEEIALMLRNLPQPDLSLNQKPKHFDESHAGPHQRYAYIAAQDSSRIHAGNSYVEQQHNYFGPKATQEKQASKIMSLPTALAFPEMSLRAANIATAQAQTCDWIFETPEFKRWIDPTFRPAHHGILWIKGKPGAGKSTVMKHILRMSQKKDDNSKSISFFYNARGQGLERSTEGMYRALLHQIVDDVPSLGGMVDSESRPIFKDQGWPLELLKDLFREAVRYYQYDRSLTCYVDALDECDEDGIRNMLQLFEDIGEMVTSQELPFSVCFTSRYYPRITIAHSEEVKIDNVRGHRDDISKYVQRRLNIRAGTALKEELALEIGRRSFGVFLWAVLVVSTLNQTGDRGNVHLLRIQLQEIPTNLRELYDDILERDSSDVNFLPIIQWSLYAARPLKAIELYFAVLASTHSLTEETIRWDKKLVDERVLRDFITSSSKGFLEIVSFTSHHNDLGEISPIRLSVQFIHESAREFFLEHGLKRLDATLSAGAAEAADAVHQQLADHCLSYMELSLAQHSSSVGTPRTKPSDTVLNSKSLDSNPFLSYILTDGLCHSSAPYNASRNFDRGLLCPSQIYNHTFMPMTSTQSFGTVDMHEKLHGLMASALQCLIQRAPDTSPLIHEPRKCYETHCRDTWNLYHIARLKVLCVLLADLHAGSPQRCRCATSLQALIGHGPEGYLWTMDSHRVAEQLIAALETDDKLVIQVATAVITHRGTFTDLPLASLCTSTRRKFFKGLYYYKELIQAAIHHFPPDEFLTSEYERQVEVARRHYIVDQEDEVFHLLRNAQVIALQNKRHGN